jgi:hypothetical protein
LVVDMMFRDAGRQAGTDHAPANFTIVKHMVHTCNAMLLAAFHAQQTKAAAWMATLWQASSAHHLGVSFWPDYRA